MAEMNHIQMIVFDWAGTTTDYGGVAPSVVFDRVFQEEGICLTKEEITAGLVPENFVGRAPQQVEEFIAHILKPIFDTNPDAVEQHANLSV